MPAKSKSQQRFMGMVRAYQKGELKNPSQAVKDVAKQMNPEDVEDYAETEHKGLPNKVKTEAKKRDYKAEYKKFQSSTKAKKYRAELNKYNRQKGTYGNGDGKDASHKNGKIVGFEKESVNRGRREKSRLKKKTMENVDMNEQQIREIIKEELLNEGKPKIYSLPTRKQDIIYKMLWHRNQPKWHTPGEFEQFIKKYFNNYLPPHIADGLKKTKSADDFVKFVRKFNFKEGVNEKFSLGDKIQKNIDKYNKNQQKNQASVVRQQLLKKFGKDPLYKEFILAKNKKEQKKALDTLKSIRGPQAVKNLQSYAKKMMGESINEAVEYYKSKKKNEDLYYKKVGNKWYKSMVSKKGKVKWYVVKFPQDLDKRDMSKINKNKLPSGLKESVNEGKKRYYQQDRVGSAKYTISYHDGKKKHKDGSDFFDIKTFRNKKDLAKFVNTLSKSGYVYGFNESVNEATLNDSEQLSKDVIQEIEEGIRRMVKEELNETKFYAFWKNKKHTINGKSLYDAKQQAITKLKIPKSKVGLLAVVNAGEHDKGSFKFEGKLKEGVVRKSIMSDGKKNYYFTLVDDETDEVKVIDSKTWLKSSLKDSSSDESKDKVIKAILKKEKQFNKKVDYNMWVKKGNPSFEKKMDYLVKNGFIKNVTKRGIKVYESVKGRKLNEVKYDTALADFNKELEKNSEVRKAAKHYKKSTKDVVKALQSKIKVNRYSDKSIKQVSINYKEDGPLSSKVSIKLSKDYKQNESVKGRKLNEATGKEKIYIQNGLLWISRSPGSGSTTRLRGRGYFTDAKGDKNFDSDAKEFGIWAKKNKPIKKKKTSTGSVVSLFSVPEYIKGIDVNDMDIWGGEVRPNKRLHMVVSSGKINVIMVFDSKAEAISWISHTAEGVNEQKIRNIIRQQLNEATLNDAEQLSKDVVSVMKKHFPGSYHHAKWNTRLYESIQGTFILGTKSQWSNGIPNNSPCHFKFVIYGMEDGNIGESKIVFEARGGLSFLIKPIKQTWLVYERIKVPARKKTANSKAILKHIDGIFSNLKKSLKKNFDKMTPEHQKEYKKFI